MKLVGSPEAIRRMTLARLKGWHISHAQHRQRRVTAFPISGDPLTRVASLHIKGWLLMVSTTLGNQT
jgi:hypothetical protein